MIQLYDRNFRKIAVLENAYEIQEEQTINSVNYLEFTLPDADPKNELCKPFHFVRYKDGDLYRIMAPERTLTETGDYLYKAEHVFAMLIDDLLEHDHVIGGVGIFTEDVIRDVLSRQLTPNWRLGECDFRFQFEYGWTDESLLAALHSIPNRFVDPYIWTFDTHVHPFVLNLKRLDMDKHPEMYIRAGKNALQVKHDVDATTVVTRLYPRGDGEGINTLTIESANGGVPFIQSPPEIVAKYGIVSRPWRDKRYTNPQSLLEAGRAMLHELQTPFAQYEVDFAVLGEDDFHTPAIGKVVEVVGFKKTVITKIVWNHDEVPKSSLSIANKPKDIAGALSDLANRQRIEATYAQGATQIYADSIVDNAGPTQQQQIDLRFFIPREMKIINAVNLRVRVSSFRAYSQATAGGGIATPTSGPSTASTTGGGGNIATTSGSSNVSTTVGGGGTTENTGTSGINVDWGSAWTLASGGHSHEFRMVTAHGHAVTFPPHSHGMSHTHTVTPQSHTHGMAHTHTLTLPSHTHQINPVIAHFGNAQSYTLFVNGQQRGVFSTTDNEIDLVPHLLAASGTIQRGQWHTISVRPNDIARVEMSYYVQGFIRSEGSRRV